MDTLTPAERSARMALVRAKNTKPEMIVRRLVHGMGYRYRLHVRTLPGSPDLVFPRLRKVVLIHGCFWHRHTCALGNRTPKSRVEFWVNKLEGNKRRDTTARRALRKAGWSVLVVWECQLKDVRRLSDRLGAFLSDSK